MLKKQSSLRKQILSWLIPLMLLLIAADSTILYRLAIYQLEKELDEDLFSSAKDVSKFLKEFGHKPADIKLLESASKIFLKDEVDEILYTIQDSTGKLISGSAALSIASSKLNTKLNDTNTPTYLSVAVNNKQFRLAHASFIIEQAQGIQTMTIQIAGTENWRAQLAKSILLGIVVPQLLLALGSFFIIWYFVKKGLAPLDDLQDAVLKRSEQDLSPIYLPQATKDVALVANAVNQLMQKLQNLISAQNRFIADAAHQLRTPLAGAQAQLELAEQENNTNNIKMILPRAYQSLDKLLHIINQLLVLARSQPEAAASINMKTLNLNLIAKASALDLAPAALKKNIDLGFEPSLVPAMINGNIERLNDLLTNLIDNAIRYTQVGGKITVGLDVAEQAVNLLVEDNGPGVSANEQDKIFDRFHREMGNTQEGSGLGLAIVKEIADMHGAKICVADANYGCLNERGLSVKISFKRV